MSAHGLLTRLPPRETWHQETWSEPLPWPQIMSGTVNVIIAAEGNIHVPASLRTAIYREAGARGLLVRTKKVPREHATIAVRAYNPYTFDGDQYQEWAAAQQYLTAPCTCTPMNGIHNPQCQQRVVAKRLEEINEMVTKAAANLKVAMQHRFKAMFPGPAVTCHCCGHVAKGEGPQPIARLREPEPVQPDPWDQDPPPAAAESEPDQDPWTQEPDSAVKDLEQDPAQQQQQLEQLLRLEPDA